MVTQELELGIADIHPMSELVSEATAKRRFQTTLLIVFAGTAFFLSIVWFVGLLGEATDSRDWRAYGAWRIAIPSIEHGFGTRTSTSCGWTGSRVRRCPSANAGFDRLAAWSAATRSFDVCRGARGIGVGHDFRVPDTWLESSAYGARELAAIRVTRASRWNPWLALLYDLRVRPSPP